MFARRDDRDDRDDKKPMSDAEWAAADALEAVNGVMPGIEVWQSVHRQVKKDAAQEPQYGAVVSAGHAEGGEWLFRTQ